MDTLGFFPLFPMNRYLPHFTSAKDRTVPWREQRTPRAFWLVLGGGPDISYQLGSQKIPNVSLTVKKQKDKS